MYNVTPTALQDVLLLEPKVYEDQRGFFMESFVQSRFEDAIQRRIAFVQDNHAHSTRNVLRGLHYQLQTPQAKLIRVVQGEILDVAVDMRRSSPQFGKWTSAILSAENKKQIWIPEGFAHGFLTLSSTSDVVYKLSSYYNPQDDCSVCWNDKDIGIDWGGITSPILSEKDSLAPSFVNAKYFI